MQVFAGCVDSENWVPVLEKAAAKLANSQQVRGHAKSHCCC